MKEDDILGDRGVADEVLLLGVAIGPSGSEGFVVVAGAWPFSVVAAGELELAGADANDIVIAVYDGSGREGLDLDGAGAVAGFLLALDGFDVEGAFGSAGAEEQCEKAESRFHWM